MEMSLFNFVRNLELGNMYCSKCDTITIYEYKATDTSPQRPVCPQCNKQLTSKVSEALFLAQIEVTDLKD